MDKARKMKVCALYSSYHNYADTWNSIIDVYANHDDAFLAQLVLEQEIPKGISDETDEQQSYYITEMEVK
jgi:hypothetical protein